MGTMEKLARRAGAYETIFTRAQRGNFLMAASFTGTIPATVWDNAVTALVGRHPMLRVRLQEDDGVLELVPAEEGNVGFLHWKREDGERWREAAGRWLAGRLGIDSKELVRVLVIEGNEGCDLLLGMHHALGDGRSALALLEDLMRAVDGVALSSYEIVPDVDSLLKDKLGPLPNLSDMTPPFKNWYTPFLPYGQPWAALETTGMSQQETERLAKRAHAEGCTVTGALAAAMVNGWRKVTPERRTEPVRLMMPVDVRSQVGLGKELMLAISTTNEIVLPEQSKDFWKFAGEMRVAARSALASDVLLGTAAGRSAAIQATSNKQELDEMSEKHLAWDLLVSNLGRWEPAYRSRSVRLTDVWGPAALYGFQGERSLGAVTFQGELRLLLSSRVAAPGLLQTILQELCEAMK